MASKESNKKLIAFIIYSGIAPLEIVGSMYMLGTAASFTREFAVVSVGQRREPLASDTPLQLIPEKTFEEVPHPYGVIVPGGGPAALPAMADPAVRDYLLSTAGNAGVIGSVGTGSLILAAAGLLQGRAAATHWAYAQVLENLGARCVSKRWVEDGKFITAAGVTAGIDMSIHLAAKLMGESNARRAQLFGEYNPHPPLGPIDWETVDRDHPPDHLLPDPDELKRAFSDRPDLLAAVDHWIEKDISIKDNSKTIAFLIYPGLTVFDLVGPLQVIASLGAIRPEFQPVVVAERHGAVQTDLRIEMVPDRTFEEEPQPYALIVPGGDTPTLRAMSNPALRRYVRSAAEGAEYVCSVCTGALILASVGLTQGRQSPTHWAFARVLESYGVRYVRKRWVEDGKFIFSQGVSSGIDAALALAARLTDEATARLVQLSLEYDPQPPLGSIDYEQKDSLIPGPVRMVIGAMSLAAPLITAGPRRMTRRAGWKPL